jgi:hypothetical protein
MRRLGEQIIRKPISMMAAPVAGADRTGAYDARQQGAFIESLGGLARLGGIRHAPGIGSACECSCRDLAPL